MAGQARRFGFCAPASFALPFDPGLASCRTATGTSGSADRTTRMRHFNMEGKRGPARHSLKIRLEVIVAGAGRRRGWPLWHDLRERHLVSFRARSGIQRSCILLREALISTLDWKRRRRRPRYRLSIGKEDAKCDPEQLERH